MKNKTDYTRPSAEKAVEKAEQKERQPRTKKAKPKAKVIADKLYFRSSPSVGNNVIMILNKGQELVIDGEEREWYKIKYDNGAVIGYVMKKFVEVL